MSIFGDKITDFARTLSKPLYVVGGAVRNYLIDKSLAQDIDLAAAIPSEEFSLALENYGFRIVAKYNRTGTVVFSDGDREYEFTAFRKEEYVKGEHTPIKTEFTQDINLDALRRDFKCNAVYYDLVKNEFIDPLGGIQDIENKIIDTVREPEQVFCNDGLRLMRLARFSGQLNFAPTDKVLLAAEKYADNIKDISPERIYAELLMILQADKKYSFSSERGHYVALKILDKTRVLDRLLPELTEGRGMAQRADFHKYDVLEHSLRSALYADSKVRLASLLHDIGKPFCLKRDGWYHYHYVEGVKISNKVLKRLKADKETIKQVGYLIKMHMVDLDCSMPEDKVRKFIVENYTPYYDLLLLVKQADYRASLGDNSTAPTLVKWERILKQMINDKTPFTLKELNVSALELVDIGYVGKEIGVELKKLHTYAVFNPQNNQKRILLERAKSDFELKKSKMKI